MEIHLWGNKLIVSSILPVRLVLGSIYLFHFPDTVLVWYSIIFRCSSFQVSKCFIYVRNYAIIHFALDGWYLNIKKSRTAPILFLLFLSIGFSLAVAYTSIETRHFAAFLLPILIVSLLPDLDVNNVSVSLF